MCRACVSTLITDKLAFSLGQVATGRRQFLASAATAGTLAAGVGTMRRATAADGAEVIFRNGTIIPMAGAARSVEALAIGGGRILALGSEADVAGMRGGATRIVDLDGRALLPGFVDPHHHTCGAAMFAEMLTDVGYTRYPTRAALTAALKAQAARTPAGQWIVCCNFDNLLQGGDLSMAELDAISTDHPIFVWYVNMHDGAANAAAFRLARIPADVGVLPGGGHFGRGADGRFNGLVYEEPAMLKFVSIAVPTVTPEMVGRALVDYAKQAAALGNTTLHEPGTIKPEWVHPLASLSNRLAVRLSASLMADAMEASRAFAPAAAGGQAVMLPDSRFSLYGIKIIGDGSNQTRTGAQTVAYLNTDAKGTTNFPPAEILAMCRTAREIGWPVLIHCNGDAAIDAALDAIEAAYGASPPTGINRIEHATMARADQLDRMKRLGVQPSFLMNHVFLYGAAYRDQLFGPQRTAFMDPAGACARAGIPFTLHTDAPCSPAGPLRLVQAAVTRRCAIDGSVIGPDQAITIDQALRAVTIDAARQIGLGGRIG
ncbi:MAG TPA: amidohydrolase, partial [Roseomonas sp.]|nr:amidohydrolase [Roseomonas sp.]